MPVLHEPVVSLEDVKLRTLSLSSLELDVAIRVQNANPLGVTLRELPFTVLCYAGDRELQIAAGNMGRVKIAARDSTLLHVPVRSQNAALIGALAAFVTRGSVQVTITGTAIIDCLLFGWSVLFSKSLPVTIEQIADSLAGQTKKE
ncbi:LEA type 2 family protein [Methanoregula sp.]|jgi:LEA14-like dessication related protein|uniref:LEA type 2 family protein n=1 Tax=Methanoregula sp. TaxID=2052170 RepID=UPI003C226E16